MKDSRQDTDRNRNKGVLLISKGHTRYADLLKDVKSEVQGASEIKSINRIRSTRKGELLIEASKDDVSQLKNKLNNKIAGVNLKTMGQPNDKMKIQISDIDAVTKEEEIVSEVIKKLEGSKMNIIIESLRLTFGKI